LKYDAAGDTVGWEVDATGGGADADSMILDATTALTGIVHFVQGSGMTLTKSSGTGNDSITFVSTGGSGVDDTVRAYPPLLSTHYSATVDSISIDTTLMAAAVGPELTVVGDSSVDAGAVVVYADTLRAEDAALQFGTSGFRVNQIVLKDFDLYTGTNAGGAYDSTDIPTNGQQLTWATGGIINWQDAGSGTGNTYKSRIAGVLTTDTLDFVQGTGITITKNSIDGYDSITFAATLGTVIDSAEIVDGTVDSAEIAANAVRGWHVKTQTLDSQHLVTNSIRSWHTKASMWGRALERKADSIDIKVAGLKGMTIANDSLNIKVDLGTIGFNVGGELEVLAAAAGSGLAGGGGLALDVGVDSTMKLQSNDIGVAKIPDGAVSGTGKIDSTASNFVFDDAYRGTSAVADSAYATELYARDAAGDSAGALRDGDTWTGVHDFGGATTMQIPNAASPTTSAEGDIAWDSGDDELEVHNGAEGLIIAQSVKTAQIVLDDPDNLVYDTVMVLYVNADKYPAGITITGWGFTRLSTTSSTMSLLENSDLNTNVSTIETISTCTTEHYVVVDYNDVDEATCAVWITFTVPDN